MINKPGKLKFSKFPKTRPPLPKEIEEIYIEHYKSNREGKTIASHLAQKLERWLHIQVAKDLESLEVDSISTLEIGAGTLNQLLFEEERGPYDIVEPFTDLYDNSPLLKRIRYIYGDISDVPRDHRYNRITSIATFEHICNLPEVVGFCGLLMAKNGLLRVSVPSEGTILWTLGWKLTTGLEFKIKHGFDYQMLLNHEHVNTAQEIEEVLEFFFKNVKCNMLGISKSISFYRFYVCEGPRVERCLDYTE